MLNAVETVESKNKELDRIISRLSADKTQSINPLSMILNGIIDAAVMGGIAKYEEVRVHRALTLPSLNARTQDPYPYRRVPLFLPQWERKAGYEQACSYPPSHPWPLLRLLSREGHQNIYSYFDIRSLLELRLILLSWKG